MDADPLALSCPIPSEDDQAADQQRRGFLAAMIAGVGAVAAAGLAVPLLKYAQPPQGGAAGANEADWMDLGALDDFSAGASPVRRSVQIQQVDGWQRVVQPHSVYVQRTADDQMRVLSSSCPHLGCSVSWKDDQGAFVCPCHQGQFNSGGERTAGPPPRGLDALECRVEEGRVKVRFNQLSKNAKA